MLSTSDPSGKIEISVAESGMLQKYRFGLRTADFLVCRGCGVYVGAVIVSAGRAFGIINVHALIDTPDDLAATTPVTYEREAVDGRIARRERRWTPVAAYPR